MKSNLMKSPLRILAILLFVTHASCADTTLKLSGLFSDHMVLQRDQAVPIWGWCEPGEDVVVEFAGQVRTAKADTAGKWVVKLEPLKASAEGRELVVAAGSGKSKITDVVVGDVWLCSGQSNMHFRMETVDKAPQEIAAANHPAIRFFSVEQQFGLKPKADVQGAWKLVSPATVADCSAVAYYFAADLQRKLGVPVGLLISSVGGTRIETWMRPETLAATGEGRSLVERWKDVSSDEFEKIGAAYSAFQHERDRVYPQAARDAKAQGSPVPPEPKMPKLRCHDCPGSLHNGMIAPLESFAIRGAIWYQGESNSGQPGPYKKMLPAMIADWRRVWGSDLPFLFVQLAPYRSTHPAFREAQHRIWQKTPRTAMAVTTDVGDANNIHPTRKRPVGERLALAARALSYGEKIDFCGPDFKNIRIDGGRAVISFEHIGGGLISKGDTLKGFTIAGRDGKFIPANAMIDGSTVIVSSDKVAKPMAVRYNWAMLPDGNLFNREELPAAPFRSDMPADAMPDAEPK